MATNQQKTESEAETPRPLKGYGPPPVIASGDGRLHQIDPSTPLHQFVAERIRNGRDVKIIITAENSATGVGKTTMAGWLAISWTKMFTGNDWFCTPDEPTEGLATLKPGQYFQIIKDVGAVHPPGTAVIVDDAEELDARRSMSSLNVKFSQRWMLMRLKQAITIITLPSPSSIDSRLEELADVWINIERRGRGLVHDIRVGNYGNRRVMTEQSHRINFPDVSDHPQLNKLRAMKEDKMDDWDQEEEDPPDPKEVKREAKKEQAQRLRDMGLPIESQDPDTPDIVGAVEMSQSWVSKNTRKPDA